MHSLAVFSKFVDWFVSGGVQCAGLPLHSIDSLLSSVQELMCLSLQLASSLEELRESWLSLVKVEVDQPLFLKRLYLHRVVVELHSIHSTSDALIAKTSQSQADLQGVRELIYLHIKESTEKVKQAEEKYNEARRLQTAATDALNIAKRALEEERKSILNVLFPISPMIDLSVYLANVAMYDLQVRTINDQMNALNKNLQELDESTKLLNSLNEIDSSLTDYLNSLIKVETAIQESDADAENAEYFSEAEELISYYEQLAGEEMNRLFDWIDIFKSAC